MTANNDKQIRSIEDTITIEDKGAVRIFRINRPEARGALTIEAMILFRKYMLELIENPEILVGVITGTGDTSFCSGVDLRNTTFDGEVSITAALLKPDDASISAGMYVRVLEPTRLKGFKPLICAINGPAMGGGLELALGCDIRVCSENATFSLAEVKRGRIPGGGGIQRLMRAIPQSKAMEMLLTGDKITADEAYRVGLVSSIHKTPEEALAKAMQLAEKIASNGPLAVRAVKMLADQGQNMPMDQAIANDHLLWALILNTEDRREGSLAFVEKREPTFKGK